MNPTDSRASLFSLLGGDPAASALLPSTGNPDQLSQTMQRQALRAANREASLSHYLPANPAPDMTGLLPLLKLLSHGAVPVGPPVPTPFSGAPAGPPGGLPQ